MTLLTAIEPAQQRRLDDAVRAVAWSPAGRVIALGANGRAAFADDGGLTAPIGPDTIGCAWISAERVAVADSVLGVVVAGGGSVDVVPVDGVVGVVAPTPSGSAKRVEHTVLALGRSGATVLGPSVHHGPPPALVATGPVRTAVHLGGSIWLAGGASGLAVVDVALGCVDQRVPLPGVVALAAAPGVGRLAASDATGAIHVLDVADLDQGVELTGYPDAVRHLGMGPLGDVVIACADDEVSWWSVAPSGDVSDEPDCSVGHEAAITACSVAATGFVATGDQLGVVRLWSPRLRDLPLGSLHLGGEVTVLSWSPSGERLAVGTVTGEVVVADLAAGELL